METSQRYIVRELYGQTIGEPTSSWQFLVLDTHDCHRVVLERRRAGLSPRAAQSARRRSRMRSVAAWHDPAVRTTGGLAAAIWLAAITVLAGIILYRVIA